MMNSMYLFFPGYYPITQKRYFQGTGIFVAVVFSSLYLLKIELFAYYPDRILCFFLWFLFALGLLGHFLSLAGRAPALPPLRESFDEIYEKARLALLRGNLELAEYYFTYLLKLSPADEDVFYQLGKTYLERGKKRKALQLFKKYLKSGRPKWKDEIASIVAETKIQ